MPSVGSWRTRIFRQESSMFKITTSLVLGFLVPLVSSPIGWAQTGITEQEAHSLGLDAYIYLYPLITMDITRKQLTNTDKGFGRGPMNAFHNVPAYPPAD